jgi:hypothetical protein
MGKQAADKAREQKGPSGGKNETGEVADMLQLLDSGEVSESDRARLRDHLRDNTDPQDLLEQRRRALLLKWSEGKRLSQDELAEVRENFPDIVRPAQEEEENREAEAARVTRTSYIKKLRDYEETTGAKVRTIKRWIATGRDAPGGADLPPLDSPAELAAWWDRMRNAGLIKHKVPDRFFELAESVRSDGLVQDFVDEEKNASARGGATRAELEIPEDVGYSAELERLRIRTGTAYAELKQAEKENDPLRISQTTSRYHESLKLLRQVEKDAARIMQEQGDLVPRQDFETRFGAKLLALRSRLEGLYLPVRVKLRAASSPEEEVEIFRAALDQIFEDRPWSGSVSSSDFQLEAQEVAG